ncbi:hypothetical protein GDO78_019624 [Eleutherodactylus coqui]|uniref:Uncharacterized protein n=1 Tax=Eleutherodactylus coqui TaxID=57060 RepID=A0A8J6JZM5_ELECQ|nr:hypothetical protein GDO78_019624 [Eleutherodactylus coqui]
MDSLVIFPNMLGDVVTSVTGSAGHCPITTFPDPIVGGSIMWSGERKATSADWTLCTQTVGTATAIASMDSLTGILIYRGKYF